MKNTIAFIKNLRFRDLDGPTVHGVKRCLLDLMGAVLGGAETRAGQISLRFAQNLKGGAEASVWPTGDKLPIHLAAFVNATMGSVLDVDDGHRIGRGHPASAVIPAIFSIAEKNGESGERLIEAIVCGYETGIRTGEILRVQNPHLKSIGGGRWGSTGSAAGVAKLLNLTPGEVEQALAISSTFAPVAPVNEDLETTGFVPMTKFSSGWGAITAFASVSLAKLGFTGVAATLDFSLSNLPPYGESFEITKVYFKPYTCCRWTHATIEAILTLVREHPEIRKDNIKKISVRTFSNACRLRSFRPRTMESAQYSIPYVAGAAVVCGGVGVDQVLESRLTDKDILGVADRVELSTDPELDRLFPKMSAADVEISTKSGQAFRMKIMNPKGDWQNPLSDEEVVEKFRKLATRTIDAGTAARLEKAIWRLEELPNIRAITEIITKAKKS
jgi:2-methylcitrate dehydratase PrpD